jgi:hypothetical protein
MVPEPVSSHLLQSLTEIHLRVVPLLAEKLNQTLNTLRLFTVED